MNQRKSNRNKRKKSTEDDSNFKVMRVRKVHPSSAPPEACGASIYEIDIKSSIEFPSIPMVPVVPMVEDPYVKLCVANVAPVALRKKNNGMGLDFSVVENPFIESYYPRFLETETESEGPPHDEIKDFIAGLNIPPDTKKPTDKESPDKKPNCPPFEEKEKPQTASPDPSTSKTKKQPKTQVLKGFATKKDNSWPLFCPATAEGAEDRLLHLHHHEHHHHYHFDPSKDKDYHRHATCEHPESTQGGRKRVSKRRKTFEEEHPRHCHHTCENHTNTTPTLTRVVVNTQADVPAAPDRKGQKTKTSESAKTFRSRASSSSESMRVKKSHLIKTHNYSDTELFRCDSDANTTDTFRVDTFLKVKSSREKQCPLGAGGSFKSLNLMTEASPEATDQKPNVKSVFIRCKYPMVEMSDSTLAYAEAEIPVPGTKTEETEEMVKTDSDLPPFVIKKCEDGTLDVEPIEIWAEKIKSELKEIKKTLRIIEKEFLEKKGPPGMEMTDPLTISEDEFGSGHEISVFSSRTFILRAENFYIIDDSDSGALSEDFETFFGNEEVPHHCCHQRCSGPPFAKIFVRRSPG